MSAFTASFNAAQNPVSALQSQIASKAKSQEAYIVSAPKTGHSFWYALIHCRIKGLDIVVEFANKFRDLSKVKVVMISNSRSIEIRHSVELLYFSDHLNQLNPKLQVSLKYAAFSMLEVPVY